MLCVTFIDSKGYLGGMKAKYDTIVDLQGVWIKVIAHFGPSKFYQTVPHLVLYHDDADLNDFGQFDFDEVEIAINIATHHTTRTIIHTMLHEYSHYLESPGWYTRYSKIFSYQNNPYEIKANKFADDHINMFTDKKR